ncbi:MAG: CHAT domain-containing protein, partial [Bacteroidia bacterium]|nr:CHAT domain-containing protein [Bacteroidia bacterium]
LPGSDAPSTQLKTIDVLRYRILYEKVKMEWGLSCKMEQDPIVIQRMYREVLHVLKLGEELISNNSLKELISVEPEIQRSLTGLALELLLLVNEESTQKILEMVSLMERLSFFEEQCHFADDFTTHDRPDTLKLCFHGLKKQLFKLHKQRFLEDPDILKPESEFVNERVASLKKLYSLDKELLAGKGDRPTYSQDDSAFQDISDLSTIYSLVGQDESIIKYLLCDSTLFTILFTTDTCVILKQDTGTEFIKDISGCIKALKVLDPQNFVHLSTRLYRQLIEPVERLLENKRSLQIIPDRQLRKLPFEALMSCKDDLSEFPEKFLIYNYEISYYTSFSSWYNRRINLAEPVRFRTYEYDFGACAPEFSGSGSTSIPHATREVEKIADLFRSESKTTRKLSGKGMRVDSLLVLGRQSRILHLATHGFRDSGHPEFSGWMLPGDPSPSPYLNNPDTRLEIGALQSFQMESDLVVLSSCSVGLESGKSWYRMTGFPYNFFRAGINNILFSLWDVSDKHTDGFMFSFYRNYLNGKSYSAALRAAKLEMLNTPETSFPTLWAVFVLWSD